MSDPRPAISADALQAAADHELPADPGTRYGLAVAQRCTNEALVEAPRERGIAVDMPPAERTPEVVLRAMLASYERAALDASIAYFRTAEGTGEEREARKRSIDLDACCANLRDAVASCLSNGNYEDILLVWGMLRDYRARLAGTRPLNAPPLEAL